MSPTSPPPSASTPAPSRRLVRRIAPLFVLGALLGAGPWVATVLGMEWFAEQSSAISRETLTRQAEEGLERYTRYEALQIDAQLGAIEDDVEDTVRDVRVALEQGPPAGKAPPAPAGRDTAGLPGYGYVSPEWGVFGDFDHVGTCGPWLSRPTLQNLRGNAEATRRAGDQLHQLCGLSESMREQMGRRAKLVDLFWVVLDSGVTVGQPPYDAPAMLAENPALRDLDEHGEPYFQLVTPANNPGRETRWLEPYLDPFRRVWMTSCVAPVYSSEPEPTFLGAIGMDILLSVIARDVLDLPVFNGGSAFLLRGDGTVVAMPSAAIDLLVEGEGARLALRRLLRPAEEQVRDDVALAQLASARIGGTPTLDSLGQRLARAELGQHRVRIGDDEFILSFSPVERAHWILGTMVPLREVLAPVRASRVASEEASSRLVVACVASGVLVLLVGLLVTWVLHRRVVRPIVDLSRVVGGIQWDELEIPELPERDDEIGILQRRFTTALALARTSRGELSARNEELSASNAKLTTLNEQLALARQAAEEASLVKSRFLVNMSHEIRTPMNAIIGMGHVMLAGSLEPEQRGRAEVLLHAARGLMRVLNDVLDLSKLEAHKLTLEQEDFALATVLRDVSDVIASDAAAKGLKVSITVLPGVPEMLRGDAYRLTQVLTNLLGNAVKFTERGEVGLTVEALPSEGPGTTLELTVRDTGIGIDPETLPKLFVPFAQGDESTTRRFGGTGLGLAICRELCETMGGSIAATSELGRGSRFRCVLPFSPPSRVLPPSPETKLPGLDGERVASPVSGAPVPSSRPEIAGAHVLLVDDNMINREVGRSLLEDLGVKVTTAADGQEAIDILARPDSAIGLVFMDVQMPGVDGLTATRAVRALPDRRLAGVPIVALTAHAMAGHSEISLAAGMNDHLTKPLEPGTLHAALVRWLRRPPASSPPEAP